MLMVNSRLTITHIQNFWEAESKKFYLYEPQRLSLPELLFLNTAYKYSFRASGTFKYYIFRDLSLFKTNHKSDHTGFPSQMPSGVSTKDQIKPLSQN